MNSHTLARDLKADILVTGHNLDDRAQTILMNLLKGDFQREFQRTSLFNMNGLTYIQPLGSISQHEINLAFNFIFGDITLVSCPYATSGRRNDVKNFLLDEESRRPGTIKTLVHSLDRIKTDLNFARFFKTTEVIKCEKCGNLAHRSPCTSCSLIELFQA